MCYDLIDLGISTIFLAWVLDCVHVDGRGVVYIYYLLFLRWATKRGFDFLEMLNCKQK